MRYIRLSEEENQKLEQLYKTSSNSVVRTRCLSLLYSNESRSIKEVSSLLRVSRRTIERFYNVWEFAENKYETLSIKEGRGAKVKLESVKEQLPDLVNQHSRNLNPILEELKTQYNIKVCKLTLQNFLKGTGL
jgi:transposase